MEERSTQSVGLVAEEGVASIYLSIRVASMRGESISDLVVWYVGYSMKRYENDSSRVNFKSNA